MQSCRIIPVIVILLGSISSSVAYADEPVANEPERPFSEEIRYIETLRGVTFSGDVIHREIRRSDLREYLRGAFARDLSISEEDYFEILRSLHLIDQEPRNPLDSLLDLYVGQVLAFYDPVENVMYSIDEVPEESPVMTAAFERAVTIHELMHALQDQRFDAGETIEASVDHWDRSLAYHALIEGEATLVMLAVLIEDLGGSLEEALADDQILVALGEAASIGMVSEETPAYFVESLKFPYVQGLAYVIGLFREGGWTAVNQAHESPPSSTEQIYDHQMPGSIAPILFPGALLETTLGEFHWRFLLGEDVADGWDADRVALVRGPEGLNVIAVTEWDSNDAAVTFAERYESFLVSRGRKPLLRVSETSVTVVYGPDRGVRDRLVERRLNQEALGDGGTEDR